MEEAAFLLGMCVQAHRKTTEEDGITDLVYNMAFIGPGTRISRPAMKEAAWLAITDGWGAIHRIQAIIDKDKESRFG